MYDMFVKVRIATQKFTPRIHNNSPEKNGKKIKVVGFLDRF